ncbi:MAG: homoserine kinase [Rhizobiaceae bacterium]|nr:homoserine kinase [Rhizobiaceae bacterium]
MAVYTEIPDNELVEYLKQYDIGELHSLKGIAEGVENSNYLLSTDNGMHILTLYEKRVKKDDLPFFLGLKDHLAENGVICPRPIAMRDGRVLGELAERPSAIISFLDGNSVKRPNPSHCEQVGQALAQMHLAGAGFELTRENALAPKDWEPLFEMSGRQTETVAMGLSAMIREELAFLNDNWPADLPSGVIHADLFPDNVFFLKGELSGLIDFYFACNDLLAYDVAICLNAWCFEADNSFNVTKAAKLLRGYNSVRPLSDREADALPVLCRGSALRFLLTRLYDWLNVPVGALVTPKDPSEYIEKLRFHRHVESASDYGIDLT